MSLNFSLISASVKTMPAQESAAMEPVPELRKPSPYHDLQIQSNDVTFYVHRVFVCPKSKKFAKECENGVLEANVTKVEHTTFETLALERMLVFMYTGDYALTKSEQIAATKPRDISPVTADDLDGTTLVEATSDSQETIPDRGFSSVPVHMYLIARYYDIADLQALALKRFKRATEVATVKELLEIANAIYVHPSMTEELRSDLVSNVQTKDAKWIKDTLFGSQLKVGLHHDAFVTDVWSAWAEKAAEREALLRQDVEAQHEMNLSLHSALEQTAGVHPGAKRNIQELKQQLKEAESARADLNAKLVAHDIRAKKDLEKWQIYQKDVQDQDKLVEEKGRLLQEEKKRADRNSELVRSREARIKEMETLLHNATKLADQRHELLLGKENQIREMDKKIQAETARANKPCKPCGQKDKRIVEETTRANKNYDACIERDRTIEKANISAAEQKVRADHFLLTFSKVQSLINKTERCRSCNGSKWPDVYKRNTKKVFIRCKTCGAEEDA